MHFGTDIERVESAVRMTQTGVDGMETITVFYKDGRMASLTHGIYARSDRKGIIYGDQGYLVVENVNDPQSISVFDTSDRLLEQHKFVHDVSGYAYEWPSGSAALKRTFPKRQKLWGRPTWSCLPIRSTPSWCRPSCTASSS